MTTETRPFGHDAEFRGLFAEEARGRLDTLAASLLSLENSEGGGEVVTALLREAHTLKGGSAMVGLPRVTRLTHLLEDLLDPYRDGHAGLSTELVDEALAAVDGLRTIIDAAAHEQEHDVRADALEERLIRATLRPTTTTSTAPPVRGGDAEPAPRAAPLEVSTIAVPVARLDELIRLVTESSSALLRTGHVLGEATGHRPSSITEFRELSRVLGQLQELAMSTRMVPVATIAHPLHRAVRDLARSLGKEVGWELRGGDTEIDRRVLDQLADPLLHLVRNAVGHGLESPDERIAAGKTRQGTVRLHAMRLGSEVILVVGDDGRGIDVDAVRAAERRAAPGGAEPEHDDEAALYGIFRSGVSTAAELTDVSGRGVGLDIVRARLEEIRGRVEVHNQPGLGCEFRLAVPITLAVVPCLVVRCGSRRYALPAQAVTTAIGGGASAILQAGGRSMVLAGGRAVPVTDLEVLLGTGPGGGRGPAVVLTGLSRSHAVRVDALEGQRDLVVKGLGGLLPRLDLVAGAAIEADGSVLVVLEPAALIERGRRAHRPAAAVTAPGKPAPVPSQTRPSILVVDDALTVRELQRSILQRAGYEVRTAADGLEALSRLAERPVDLVLTDVEMPRMDGFALTEAIRAHRGLRNTAVLMLTSRAGDDDRRRGLEAGADGYIVKSAFDQAALVDAVERLLGARA